MIQLLSFMLLLSLISCFEVSDSNYAWEQEDREEKIFEKKKYYCEYCGKEFKSIKDMSINSCKKHPKGVYEGSHKAYRGDSKKKYECRYCGKTARTIFDLVSNKCKEAPRNGYHRPR